MSTSSDALGALTRARAACRLSGDDRSDARSHSRWPRAPQVLEGRRARSPWMSPKGPRPGFICPRRRYREHRRL